MDVNINSNWKSYELIDCGNLKKIEKFGNYTLIRPEISAKSKPMLSESEWRKLADCEFVAKDKKLLYGEWKKYKNMLDSWHLIYETDNSRQVVINLKLTKTKHIGVFPEQLVNWKYISDRHQLGVNKGKKMLNLFGYTGVASVVGALAGFNVTHIDSIKKNINWGKQNMQSSGVSNVRWICEDAAKFVEKEIRRSNKYSAIILDPPAIGKGPKNETWILENDLEPLLSQLKHILEPESFVILNLYSSKITDKYLHKLILSYFDKYKIDTCDCLFGASKHGNKIDHGHLVRITSA